MNNFMSNTIGSSLMLPANGLGGSRATINTFRLRRSEKNRAKPEKQKGKKEGGWGEGPEGKPLASDGVKIFPFCD